MGITSCFCFGAAFSNTKNIHTDIKFSKQVKIIKVDDKGKHSFCTILKAHLDMVTIDICTKCSVVICSYIFNQRCQYESDPIIDYD